MTNVRARMSAEIPALGPSCASHRRSSNANSLGGRHPAGSPEICATFQRDFATTFLSSSPPTPARQSRLCGPCPAGKNLRDIPASYGDGGESLRRFFLHFGRRPANFGRQRSLAGPREISVTPPCDAADRDRWLPHLRA